MMKLNTNSWNSTNFFPNDICNFFEKEATKFEGNYLFIE